MLGHHNTCVCLYQKLLSLIAACHLLLLFVTKLVHRGPIVFYSASKQKQYLGRVYL